MKLNPCRKCLKQPTIAAQEGSQYFRAVCQCGNIGPESLYFKGCGLEETNDNDRATIWWNGENPPLAELVAVEVLGWKKEPYLNDPERYGMIVHHWVKDGKPTGYLVENFNAAEPFDPEENMDDLFLVLKGLRADKKLWALFCETVQVIHGDSDTLTCLVNHKEPGLMVCRLAIIVTRNNR